MTVVAAAVTISGDVTIVKAAMTIVRAVVTIVGGFDC